MKNLFFLSMVLIPLSFFAQNTTKRGEESCKFLTVDSFAFNNYYWFQAEKNANGKIQKIHILSEKINSENSPDQLTPIRFNEEYKTLKVSPLAKIRMDSLYVKPDELIFTYDGKTITGAGKTFYSSECIDGIYMIKKCLTEKRNK